MLRNRLLGNASLIALLTVSLPAQAQQSLPTIDVGKPRATRHAAPSHAPTNPAPAPARPSDDDIKVEAPTRTLVSQSRAPAAVTVLTGERIAQGIPGRVGEALKTTPGIYMRGSTFDLTRPGNSVGTLTMRGIPGSTRTMVIVDGVPLNSPFAGTIDYSTIPSTGLDRIEVVPGAFSSLYGTSAMGGVVNIISKAPTKREGGVTASVGGFATDSDVSGNALTERLSAYYRDILPGGLGVSLNFSGTNSSGYADEFATKAATTTNPGANPVIPVCCVTTIPTSTGGSTILLGNRGIRPWDTMNARGQFYYDVDANTHLTAGTFFGRSYNGYGTPESDARNALGFGVYNGWIAFRDQYGAFRRVNYNDGTSNPFLTFSPTGEWTSRSFARGETKLGDVLVKGSINYTVGDAWNVNPTGRSVIVAGTPGVFMGGLGTYTPAMQQRWIGNLQADIPLFSWHMLTVGTQYQRDRFDRDITDLTNVKDPYSKTGAVSYSTHGRANILAFFVQDKADITDWLTVYLGGRYDNWHTSGNTWQNRTPVQNTLPIFSVFYPDRYADAFSPKGSVVVTPMEGLTLRGSVGRAFNLPQLFQMYTRSQTTLTNFTDGDPNLKPEKLTSWEVGFDYRFATTGTRVRATYYENYLYDMIYTYATGLPGGVTQNTRINAGQARIKGVEGGVEQDLAIIAEGFSTYANLTYNDSLMISNPAQPASVGAKLTFTPRWMLNGGFAYKNGPWYAELNGRYNSKVYTDDQNRDLTTGIPTFYDSYFTMDGKVTYAFNDNIKGSVVVTNLTDLKYYQFYLQPRRAVFGEISYQF